MGKPLYLLLPWLEAVVSVFDSSHLPLAKLLSGSDLTVTDKAPSSFFSLGVIHCNQALLDKTCAVELTLRAGSVQLLRNESVVLVVLDSRSSLQAQGQVLFAAVHWLLYQADRLVIHAAYFNYKATRVLVFGESGSGKSTLSLAVLKSGGRVLGDDLLVVGKELERGLSFHSFRRDVRIRRGSLGLLPPACQPYLTSFVALNGEAKHSLSRTDCPDLFLDESYGVDRILLLTQPGKSRETQIKPNELGAKLLLALKRYSQVLSWDDSVQRSATLAFSVLGDVLHQAPAFSVALGSEFLNCSDRHLDRLLGLECQ